jgi:effector-binding domain-containing protein
MSKAFQIVHLEAQHVISVRMDIEPANMAKTLSEILPEIWQYIAKAGGIAAGPAFCRSEMTPGGLLGLEAGFPVAAPLPAQGHIQPKELPGGDAAKAVHMGDYVEIPKTRKALLQWVLEEGREPAGPAWSTFVNDPAHHSDPSKWQTDIYLPLRPAT